MYAVIQMELDASSENHPGAAQSVMSCLNDDSLCATGRLVDSPLSLLVTRAILPADRPVAGGSGRFS